jgi:hypothetical protein
MKTLFLVGSAIHTRFGVFSAEERLEQTLGSLQSIRGKVPDAKIILSDSGAESPLTEEDKKSLTPFVNALISYHDDEQVQAIYRSTENWDIVKSYTELLCTAKTLSHLLSFPALMEGVDRIYKLSGRYRLADSFSLDAFQPDRYAFARRRKSQFEAKVTGGLSCQLMTRLWSWPANRTGLVLARYNLMLEDFSESLKIGQYRDIEHLMLRYFEGPLLQELDTIGVMGALGPNGVVVQD